MRCPWCRREVERGVKHACPGPQDKVRTEPVNR